MTPPRCRMSRQLRRSPTKSGLPTPQMLQKSRWSSFVQKARRLMVEANPLMPVPKSPLTTGPEMMWANKSCKLVLHQLAFRSPSSRSLHSIPASLIPCMPATQRVPLAAADESSQPDKRQHRRRNLAGMPRDVVVRPDVSQQRMSPSWAHQLCYRYKHGLNLRHLRSRQLKIFPVLRQRWALHWTGLAGWQPEAGSTTQPMHCWCL